jgi:uncharacterized protein
MGLWLKDDRDGVLLKVRVTPRSSKNSVIGIHEDALAVKLTSPPAEGKANEALIGFIADLFGVRKKDVEIKNGISSRNKTIRITGINAATARSGLEKILP